MAEEEFKYSRKLVEAMDALWKYSPSDEALQKAKLELANSAAQEFTLELSKGTYRIGDKEEKGIIESIQGMLQAVEEPEKEVFKPLYKYFQDTCKSITTFVKANPEDKNKKKDFTMKKCKVLLEKVKLEAKTIAAKVGKAAAMAGISFALALTVELESIKLLTTASTKFITQTLAPSRTKSEHDKGQRSI
jgi:hypothetical protein